VKEDNGFALVAIRAMRARRCYWAIGVVWLWEVLLGLVIAWPVAAIVRVLYGGHPDGDGPLWNAGGLPLVDLLLRQGPAAAGVQATLAVVLTIASIGGLVPLGMLLVSLAYGTRDGTLLLRVALGRSLDFFSSLAVLLVLVSLLEALFLFAAVGGGIWLVGALIRSAGEPWAYGLGAVFLGTAACLVAVAGVVHDLGRAAAVCFRVGAIAALRIGLEAFRQSRGTALWSWAWRSGAGLVPIAVGAGVCEHLGGQGGTALLVVAAIHQLAVLIRVALRASWLSRALRMVSALGARP
jgi:hypothetical protein